MREAHKFPARIQTKRHDQHGQDWHWWNLCWVWDNEALGVMERLLGEAAIEFRTVPDNYGAGPQPREYPVAYDDGTVGTE